MSVTVVLDSNALWADPALRGAAVGRLMAMSRRGLLRLAIPAVVLAELRRHRVEAIQTRVDQLRKMPGRASTALDDLGVDPGLIGFTMPAFTEVDVEWLISVFEAEVTHRMRINSVETLDVPNIPVTNILARDLAGRRPFEPNGRGFRDALIWESIVAHCAALAPDDDVYLVTSDRNFGDSDTLAPELADDLAQGGGWVTRVGTIDALLRMPELSEGQLKVQREIEVHDDDETATAARFAVEGAVEELVAYSPTRADLQLLSVPEVVDEVWIESIDNLREFDWSPYDELDGTTVLGQATVALDIHLEGTCRYSDAVALSPDQMQVIGDEPDDDTWVPVMLTRPARAAFDVRIELLGADSIMIRFESLLSATAAIG